MNIIVVYWSLDMFFSLIQAASMQLFMLTMTEKKSSFKKNAWMFLAFYVLRFTVLSTIAELPGHSVIIQIGTGLIWAAGFKFSTVKGLGLAGFATAWDCSIWGIAAYIGSFFMRNVTLVPLVAWAYMIVFQFIVLIASIALYRALRNFYFKWDAKDFILIGMIGCIISLVLDESSSLLFVKKTEYYNTNAIFPLLLSAGVFLLIVHFQNNSRIRAQEEQVRIRAMELEGQVDYYQAKAAEELRIRKLYHDMKNMVIALKAEHGTSELLTPIEEELKGFERFYETGNSILNVLLKEKIEIAQAQSIDLQADVELSDSDFIESRDLVILLGNALDNALEASMRIAAGERMITLKAGRMRDMLLITVENNKKDGVVDITKSSKEDLLLHGFGIKHIRDTAMKYGGECVIEQENKQFCLKVMIPIPLT